MPDQKFLNTKLSPFLRPQSAAVGTLHLTEEIKDQFTPNQRPCTTNARQRGELSSKKVMRQNLRKSHFKAVGRECTTEVAKFTHLFGLDSQAEMSGSGSGRELEVVTVFGSEKLGHQLRKESYSSSSLVHRVNSAHADDSAKTHPLGPLRRQSSFDTWISGSPHDSDEYDTDLEENTATILQVVHQPSDAGGASVYEEQCRKNGFVPVSYLRRHLGKRTIRMRHHYLGGNAAKPLAAAFMFNTVTEHLDLSDNYLEPAGAAYLASMLRHNSFIIAVDISNNFIGSYGCAKMAEMLDANVTLKTLSLAGNKLVDRDAHCFIEPLKNNLSLSSLDLSHNEFADKGGVHLGAAINVNDGLNDLDLSWNSLHKQGAVAIAKALQVNTSLEVLDLSWNGFGLEGAAALQQALQLNKSLKVLDLTNNRIDTPSALKLAMGLKKNHGLETFILNLNPIGDDGIEAILKSAMVHPNLHFLSMEEMGINHTNLGRIQELEQKKHMIILHGGSGGYQRNSNFKSILRLFSKFSQEHLQDLKTAFASKDKDHSNILTTEETKQCLRMAGLHLTNKLLDVLIDEIDFSHSGQIKYREILTGKTFDEYHKRRPSRGFSLSNEISDLQENYD